MKREILLTQDANEKQVAILEDGRLEEFYIERAETRRMFGSIYKGIVKTVIPGIDAAFVDLGTGKDGFLHVADAHCSPLDLDADFDEDVEKQVSRKKRVNFKRINEVLKVGQELIVQVVKEPIRSKGPRLTTQFSIPARYLVMMPGEEKIGISKKIENRAERDRIRKALRSLEVPRGMGFIVRTNAEGKSDKELNRDVRYLVRLWKKIHATIARKKAPILIHQELGLVERIVRDHLTEDTAKLIVDHYDLHRKLKRFISVYMPGQNMKIDFAKERGSIFEKYGIGKEIERTYQKTVPLKLGGSIVIEQTEGLVAIDVNTGRFTGNRNLEDTVFKTNIEAAGEVARQLRLRDAGGIIIIDFIDMERYEHRRRLFRTFREAMNKDRAKTHILQMTELGLIEMTRQRIRPSLESAIYDSCPYCGGKGMVKSATTMAIKTVKDLRRDLRGASGKIVNVTVHPDVADRLLNQEKKAITHLERVTKCYIHIFGDSSAHREDVNFTFVK